MAKKKIPTDPLEEALRSATLDGDEGGVMPAPKTRRRRPRVPAARIVIHPAPDDTAVVSALIEKQGDKQPRRPRSTGLYGPREGNLERRWLQWLARFADKGKSEIEVFSWSKEFELFVAFVRKQAWIADADWEQDAINPAEIANIIHNGIETFLQQGQWLTPPLPSLQFTLSCGAEERATVLPYAGRFRDAILLGMLRLLGEHGHRLRRCAALNCDYKTASGAGRLFFAAKRQIYCSNECYGHDSMRKFIEQIGGPAAYAEYRAEKRKERITARQKQRNDPVIQRARKRSRSYK